MAAERPTTKAGGSRYTGIRCLRVVARPVVIGFVFLIGNLSNNSVSSKSLMMPLDAGSSSIITGGCRFVNGGWLNVGSGFTSVCGVSTLALGSENEYFDTPSYVETTPSMNKTSRSSGSGGFLKPPYVPPSPTTNSCLNSCLRPLIKETCRREGKMGILPASIRPRYNEAVFRRVLECFLLGEYLCARPGMQHPH